MNVKGDAVEALVSLGEIAKTGDLDIGKINISSVEEA